MSVAPLFPRTFQVLGFIIAISTLSACSAEKVSSQSGSCSSRVAVTYSGTAERSYCSTVTSYPGGVPVSGHAYYVARTGTTAGLNALTGNMPIRFAEIEVLNSSGTRVQCGTTGSAGEVSLTVPSGTENLTIRVNSRSNVESELRASVMNCPEENGLYSVSTTFMPTGTPSVTLTAQYTGDIISGAFNILDQLYKANEFLRNRVGNCGGATADECTPVTTSAPKVKAYWQKGFNPNAYFGDADSGVSFYIPGTSRLFILGGIRGDTDNTDTDHFDNSVIIHEYGHFLEDIYSTTNSPGGSHSGNKVIDPRLAWSEGWGDFIQGAVLNVPTYYDTVGNSSGTIPTSTTFEIPVEAGSTAYNDYFTNHHCTTINSYYGCDYPETSGEGNFREFSVSRMLWDISDGTTGNTDSGTDGIDNQFLNVWKAMTSVKGFKDPKEEFRAIGYIHDYVENVIGPNTAWATLRSNTKHKHGLTTDYAEYVGTTDTTGAACGTGYLYDMTPTPADGNDLGRFQDSNLASNNDFYFYYHPGGTLDVKLTYETTSSSDEETDLDLFVYNSKARYGNSTDMKLISQTYFDDDSTTPETEEASKSLPAGNYLINVKAYTGQNTSGAAIGQWDPDEYMDTGGPLHYKLQIKSSGVYVPLCPTKKSWK